jgi:putative intracellular protease/amidase
LGFAPIANCRKSLKSKSQGGLAVTVKSSLQHCLDWTPDVVVFIGGMAWERSDAPDIRNFLRTSCSSGATIAGICGGTLALARAGLLDTVPHTSNSADFLQQNAVDYEASTLYRNSPVAVVADRIITAPGPAPISFTCAVFESAGLSSEIVSQFRSMLAAEH